MKQIEWSKKQRSTIQKSFRHCLEVEEGTPRSGKTTCAVARFAWFLWNTPDQNHLVLAYNQEQAFRLVMDCDGLGLLHIYQNLTEQKHDDFGDYVLLHAPNGGKKVYYKGAGKADSHKAFTGLSLGSVFFCEINLLHMPDGAHGAGKLGAGCVAVPVGAHRRSRRGMAPVAAAAGGA